jgi:DNA gyrase subunit A
VTIFNTADGEKVVSVERIVEPEGDEDAADEAPEDGGNDTPESGGDAPEGGAE